MDKTISPEKRQEYLSLRDSFLEDKNNVLGEINNHDLVIQEHSKEISKLEKRLKDSRPRIEGCDRRMICKSCDIYSMEFQGSTSNPDKVFYYNCVICGMEDYHT